VARCQFHCNARPQEVLPKGGFPQVKSATMLNSITLLSIACLMTERTVSSVRRWWVPFMGRFVSSLGELLIITARRGT